MSNEKKNKMEVHTLKTPQERVEFLNGLDAKDREVEKEEKDEKGHYIIFTRPKGVLDDAKNYRGHFRYNEKNGERAQREDAGSRFFHFTAASKN
jgi:hypothetical protein